MTDTEKIESVKNAMEIFHQKMMRVALLKNRLAELEDDIRHPSIQQGRSGTKGNISAGAARLILIKAEVEEQLQEAQNEYGDELAEMLKRLRRLPLPDRIILEQRYIFDTPVQKIQEGLNMSKATYYDSLDRACVEFYNQN